MKETFPTGKQKKKKSYQKKKKKITKIAGWEIYKQKVFASLLVVQSCITIYWILNKLWSSWYDAIK